jgi:hypothetical protein
LPGSIDPLIDSSHVTCAPLSVAARSACSRVSACSGAIVSPV